MFVAPRGGAGARQSAGEGDGVAALRGARPQRLHHQGESSSVQNRFAVGTIFHVRVKYCHNDVEGGKSEAIKSSVFATCLWDISPRSLE